MKWLLFFILPLPVLAQETPNTEIFLFDITSTKNQFEVSNGENISQNDGYDNQPSFYSEEVLIYARTRNGQTDIAGFNLDKPDNFWISNTPVGSEYSPQRISGSKDVAAVRLDTTGLQLLYRYDWETGAPSVLLPDLKVGYFAFYNEKILLTTVLTGSDMHLFLNDLEKETSDLLVTKVGRSVHKVPGTDSMSYTVMNEEKTFDLYLLDLDGNEPESFFLTTLPEGVQDYSWLDRDRLILGKGSEIYLYDILGKSEWIPVADLSEDKLDNITRLDINKEGTKLVFVAEITD